MPSVSVTHTSFEKYLKISVALLALFSCALDAHSAPRRKKAARRPASAEYDSARPIAQPFHLMAFRLEQWTVLQARGEFFSGMIHWRPQYQLDSHWFVAVSGGAGLLQNPQGDGFAVYDFHGSIEYRSYRLGVEFSPGYQLWGNGQGGYFALRSALLFHFDSALDHVYAAWSELFGETPETRQYHFGIGIVF